MVQVPPQSTSPSLPFLTVSLQVGAEHLPAAQIPLRQSAAPPQDPLVMHFVAHEPPQSLSVSVPFFTPSLHEGARHFIAVPPVGIPHTPEVQSRATAHALLSGQGAQPPPQSRSVSVPFFTLSMQVGAWQVVPVQTPETQSAAPPQPSPVAHLPQLPPQSTSVSF